MQFVVPQFIDVENKIIGPVSTRQFIIIVVVGGVGFLLFRLAPTWLFVIGVPFDLVFGGALAFVKVNGQPFHLFLVSIIQTLKRPALRVWSQDVSKKELKQNKKEENIPKVLHQDKPLTSKSRLAELSLILDTGGAYHQNNPFEGKIKEPYYGIVKNRVQAR